MESSRLLKAGGDLPDEVLDWRGQIGRGKKQARALAAAHGQVLEVAANRGAAILAGSDAGTGNSCIYSGERPRSARLGR